MQESYPISDSSWVSPMQCVPKKGGITVVENEKNELIPTRTVTGWRVCMDYRKLNKATRKDHFPLSFIDQMLDRLAGHDIIVFWMAIQGIIRFVLHQRIRKRLPSLVHLARLLFAEFRLGYVAPRPLFRDV